MIIPNTEKRNPNNTETNQLPFLGGNYRPASKADRNTRLVHNEKCITKLGLIMCGTPLSSFETQVGGDTETKYTNLKKIVLRKFIQKPHPTGLFYV